MPGRPPPEARRERHRAKTGAGRVSIRGDEASNAGRVIRVLGGFFITEPPPGGFCMALAQVVNTKPLANRDRVFLALYFANGLNATEAWFQLCQRAGKPCTRSTAEVQGSKALKRVRQSGDFRAILEERGLDDLRLAAEIDRLLRVKKTFLTKAGEAIDCEDGQTQVKAAEMLKDVLGHNSPKEINVNNRPAQGLTLNLLGAKDLPSEELAE